MSCANPVDAAVLAEYWIGALAGGEEERVDEHLLECDECGARLREVMALADGVRRLARGGSLRMIVSESFVRRMEEEGARVREYELPEGGSVRCTVTAEDDVLIARLAADLSGARRVDLGVYDERGRERGRLKDIPFHPEAGSVAFQESITRAKAAPSETVMTRLIAVDEAGGERLLGEYTFHHTRSLPGAGDW